MGMSAFVLDTEAQKLDAAIEAANQWVDTARPIIQAYLAIDDAPAQPLLDGLVNKCRPKWREKQTTEQRVNEDTWREAYRIVTKARDDLFDMLGGIRDNFLCDEKLNASQAADDAEWDHVEAFNEELERQCITVDAAIRLVEREA